jgi:hypothetical protein
MYVAIIELLAVLLFLWRTFQIGRNQRYVGREKKLALEFSGLIEEKCKLLEKVSLIPKEHEGSESSTKNGNFEESTGTQSLETTHEKQDRSRSKLVYDILLLEKELKEEKSKHSQQDELMADIAKRIQS